MLPTTVFLIAAAAGAAADTGDDEAARQELKKFQGTWRVVSYVEDGKSKPAKEINDMELVFTGDTFAVRRGGEILERGTQKLFPKKKALDHTITSGDDKGKTYPGIYQLKGDALTFCFAPAGGKRPTTFES